MWFEGKEGYVRKRKEKDRGMGRKRQQISRMTKQSKVDVEKVGIMGTTCTCRRD